MADLYLHGREVNSVFQLLGEKENDITFSMAWALSKSRPFLDGFLKNLLGETASGSGASILLQNYEESAGFTDIEIKSEDFLLIIEAKKGWTLPGKAQLLKYAGRFDSSGAPIKRLIVLSECSHDYAKSNLPPQVGVIPVQTTSWRDVAQLARKAQSRGSNAAKRLIREFLTYLDGVVPMQPIQSNWVYVVALGKDIPPNWDISWIDVVKDRLRYFHPVAARGFPKEPPNYIAFRYNGRLQSIHHVDDYTVFNDPHPEFPEIPSGNWGPHYLYSLGPTIKPNKEVKTGKLYRNGRVWCMLDTLLVCDTISEARDLSQSRLGKLSAS